MVYGLCESPMTIQAMLDWYQQLLNEDIRLRYIVNLEVMYSSDSEQKSLAALSEALKSKGVEHVDELDDDDLDSLDMGTEDVDDEEEMTKCILQPVREAAANLESERAAALRDQIKALKPDELNLPQKR